MTGNYEENQSVCVEEVNYRAAGVSAACMEVLFNLEPWKLSGGGCDAFLGAAVAQDPGSPELGSVQKFV